LERLVKNLVGLSSVLCRAVVLNLLGGCIVASLTNPCAVSRAVFCARPWCDWRSERAADFAPAHFLHAESKCF